MIRFPAAPFLVLACLAGVPAFAQPAVPPAGSSAPTPPDPALAVVRELTAAGLDPDLRWPDFTDYRKWVAGLYEVSGGALVWVRDGAPTPQARAALGQLETAESRGLDPEDYDGSRWKGRVAALSAPGADPAAAGRFDLALTVSVMRYISDLHIGRINPRNVSFGLDVEPKKLHLPTFVAALAGSPDVVRSLEGVEPRFAAYDALRAQLPRYLALSREVVEPLPPLPPKAKVAPGQPYAAADRLASLLEKLGDLPPGAVAGLPKGVLGGELVTALKRFQDRHGLEPDGTLGSGTLAELNTPLASRLRQIQLTLERWRWLPVSFEEPPVVVNIPQFRLWAMRTEGGDFRPDLTMRVVVGKAFRHETNVFAATMRQVVLRPFWNVPVSIVRREILPALAKDPGYLAKHRYQVVDRSGTPVEGTPQQLAPRMKSGALQVQQLPGPKNSLGLVKFLFPNPYNIYLHDTPAPALFSRSRRDFSHGCVRVESPVDLAVWALRGEPGEWTAEKVKAAMSGEAPVTVNLKRRIPVLILYATAVVNTDGALRFFEDIYGHDEALEAALASGYPYPG